jgi:hypothetical protein
MNTKNKAFWITNISKRNVSLADLNLTINALSSINLLEEGHYYYTVEELEKSAKEGSIYHKRDKIFVRTVEPEVFKMNIPFDRETFIPNKERSLFKIKQEIYEELSLSDEAFAEENADIAEQDRQPTFKKG